MWNGFVVDRVPRSCFKGGVAAVTQPFDKRLAMQEGQGATEEEQSSRYLADSRRRSRGEMENKN